MKAFFAKNFSLIAKSSNNRDDFFEIFEGAFGNVAQCSSEAFGAYQ